MISLDDVAKLALALPEAAESGHSAGRQWNVAGKMFAWERPFRKADIRRFGDQEPPSGTILAVRVENLGVKEALLAEGHPGVFTIPHFDGYSGVLIQLSVVSEPVLRELVEDAWFVVAPRRLTDAYIAGQGRDS